MEPWQREFAETVAKHRRQGWGWRYDGVEGWTSEAIFAQLRELGIDADAQRFRHQAIAAGGIKALTKSWNGQIREEMDTEFWPDFPLVSVPVLWERLAADVICAELVDERLHRVIRAEKEGEALPDVNGVPADVRAAMGLVEYLRGFNVAQRAGRFKEVQGQGIYDYSDWLLDLVGHRATKYPEEMLQVADMISSCVDRLLFQSEAAMLAAAVSGREAALVRARAMSEQTPDDPWSWIFAGDVHRDLEDLAEAIRLYGQALAIAREPDDWDVAADRLKEACGDAGRMAGMAEILRRHPSPKPVSTSSRPASSRPISVAPPPLFPPRQTQKKIGRNDPCPCGSGKKYKRCCLR